MKKETKVRLMSVGGVAAVLLTVVVIAGVSRARQASARQALEDFDRDMAGNRNGETDTEQHLRHIRTELERK